MERITLNKVNKALAAKGYSVELVKAPDYFYFSGADTANLEQTMVYVCRLSELETVADWVAEFENLPKY